MAHLLPSEPPVPNPQSGEDEFANLQFYEAQRTQELGQILRPVVDLTDGYGRLIARITWVAGQTPPMSEQDRVVRDLMADTFDFLWEWRRIVLEAKEAVAYPIARRAYESLSLLGVCLQDADVARRWQAGEQIGNAEIRTRLASLPLSESHEVLQKLYKFFSKGSHPNRDLVAHRHLGDGNQFVLGAIGGPMLLLTVDHCMRLIEMWYWLLGVATQAFRQPIADQDPHFRTAYQAVITETPRIIGWLGQERDRLLEAQARDRL